MCDVTTALGVGSLILGGATAYDSSKSNRIATRNANARQARQIRQNINENQRDFQSENTRAQLNFQGAQEAADRARQIDERQNSVVDAALEPIGRLGNFEEDLAGKTQEQADVFRGDIDASIKDGSQNIGSGLEGNVSEAFTSASNDAQGAAIGKATTNSDRRARLAGVTKLFQDDVNAVTQAGQSAGIETAAIQRQREIDQYLRLLSQNRADLESRIAPAPVEVI